MFNVMLDLETMGNKSDAAIIAVGAVLFDITSGDILSSFYKVVDLESSMEIGGKCESSTILWWMKQSDSARSELQRNGEHVSDVLQSFSVWIKGFSEESNVDVWGNGAAFDNIIMKSAYNRARIEVPWTYKNDRCYRTVRELYPSIEIKRKGVYHNALDDAESQALHLVSILNKLKLGKNIQP